MMKPHPTSAIHAQPGCTHDCTSLGVAGTFYSHWEAPLQHRERKEDPSYTARKRPTVLIIIIIIRTSDIKQDTGLAQTVAMVAG